MNEELPEYKAKVTLIRGAKGVYRWEITCKDNDDKLCTDRTIKIDIDLKVRYGDVSE